MQKRKGFTLVELVIVIAVIAILAGVLIGTFASVLSKANESARMQEMKAAEHDQKASDILNKLNNAQWFGWEDLETKIGTTIQASVKAAMSDYSDKKITSDDLAGIKAAVTTAIDQAIAKYAVAQGQENTQLTAEQVQYIVEQAVSKKGGVTEAQVQAIVTNAVKNLQTPLSANQVQRIVDAAVKKVTESGLTASDLATALANVATNTSVEQVLQAVNTAASKQSTLTADEVAVIVAKYVSENGTAKGDYSWWVSNKEELNIEGEKAEEQLVALAVLSSAGETFEGQTITIDKLLSNVGSVSGAKNAAPTIVLESDWIPIKLFKGTLVGNGATIKNINFEITVKTTNSSNVTGYSCYLGYNSDETWYGDKMGYGFIDVLDGSVTGLNLEYNMKSWSVDPGHNYTYFGGVAGIMREGASVTSCTVSGDIKAWNRTGGVTGMIYMSKSSSKTDSVTISDCTVTATITNKVHEGTSNSGYGAMGGLVGGVFAYMTDYIAIEGGSKPKHVYMLEGLSVSGTTSGATLICLGNDVTTTNWDSFKHNTIGYANNTGLGGSDKELYYVYASVTNDTLHADGQVYCTYENSTLTTVPAA